MSGESSENIAAPPNNLTHYEYPEAANYPPEGWQFVTLDPDAERTTDGFSVYVYISKPVGGQIWLDGSGVVIQPYGVNYSTWIGEYKESRTALWVAFEPHGLTFVSPQYARISYRNAILPPAKN
jgi:hypothetical protein